MEIRKGSHTYEIGDQGGLLVSVTHAPLFNISSNSTNFNIKISRFLLIISTLLIRCCTRGTRDLIGLSVCLQQMVRVVDVIGVVVAVAVLRFFIFFFVIDVSIINVAAIVVTFVSLLLLFMFSIILIVLQNERQTKTGAKVDVENIVVDPNWSDEQFILYGTKEGKIVNVTE